MVPKRRAPRAFGKILLAVAAAFAAAEIVLRLAGVPQNALVYQDSENPSLRFELKPGAEGMKNGAPVKINLEGLRERELPLNAQPGELRMVAVGDHATFGLGLPAEQVYPRLVEAGVKAPRDVRLTTVNLSMYHYDLSQLLELLRSRGTLYHPDLVVFQISPSNRNPLPLPLLNFPRLKNFARAHSHLARFLMEYSFFKRSAPLGAPDPGVALKRMRSLAEFLKQWGLQGQVLYVPDLRKRNVADSKQAAEAYRKACREAGIPYMDASAVLGAEPARYLIRPSEPFLNAEGQKVLAGLVAPFVRKWLGTEAKKRLTAPRVPAGSL